jgi:dihydroorotate dehydrogenase
MYRLFFRLLVFARIDGESAHDFAARALRAAWLIPGVRRLVRFALTTNDPRLRVPAFGLEFPSPLGLAAGVDSNAAWFEQLGALGFGSVEVGTVTASAQQGNPKPRVLRLVADRAILNRRGFPNVGAAVVAKRLRQRQPGPIVGVNVGKTKTVSLDDASADYRSALKFVGPFADYLVLNVSSPNTPGLRDMQSVDRLRELLRDARAELASFEKRVPLLVKIAPDLSDEELDAIADLAVAESVDGIIAVNTTVSRRGLKSLNTVPKDFTDGGISGAPLRNRSLDVLRRVRSRVGNDVFLVSVGGVENANDVLERIRAGATLVQAHTAFVYSGPLWPWRVNRALSRQLNESGVRSITDLIGVDAIEHHATSDDDITPRDKHSRPAMRRGRARIA